MKILRKTKYLQSLWHFKDVFYFYFIAHSYEVARTELYT